MIDIQTDVERFQLYLLISNVFMICLSHTVATGEGASAKTASQDARTPQIRCFEHSSVCSLVSDKYNNVM